MQMSNGCKGTLLILGAYLAVAARCQADLPACEVIEATSCLRAVTQFLQLLMDVAWFACTSLTQQLYLSEPCDSNAGL